MKSSIKSSVSGPSLDTEEVDIHTAAIAAELKHFRQAFMIGALEQKLLRLFLEGKLSGTVHTCIGLVVFIGDVPPPAKQGTI